jgi:hypothetical protein
LNPRWGSSFYLYLPCPKHILQSYIDDNPNILSIIEDNNENKKLIYQRICKELINFLPLSPYVGRQQPQNSTFSNLYSESKINKINLSQSLSIKK